MFNTGQAYLTRAELDHIAFVIENEPLGGSVYKGENGELRKVFRVAYPTGVITNDTVYTENHEHYHTPLATVTESREAKVWYIDVKTGGHHICYSREWFEWLGKGKMTQGKPSFEASPAVKRQLDAQRNMVMSAAKSTKDSEDEQAIRDSAVAEYKKLSKAKTESKK